MIAFGLFGQVKFFDDWAIRCVYFLKQRRIESYRIKIMDNSFSNNITIKFFRRNCTMKDTLVFLNCFLLQLNVPKGIEFIQDENYF